jgi:hypothetical protein
MPNIPAPSAPTTRVRLGGPEEIVAAVPHLLGFHPRESVVAIGLRGRRSRVCVSLRFDLPARASEPDLAALVADHLRTARASAAIVLILTEEPAPDGTLPRPELAGVIDAALAAARIGVRDLLCVHDGRWWSYVCDEPDCCPPEGRPVPTEAPSLLVAATVADGQVVHQNRDDLVATVAPVAPVDDGERRERFAAAERRLADRPVPAIERTNVLGAIEATIRSRVEADRPLDGGEVARFCVALGEVEVRDACLRWLDGPLADAAEGLWRELTRSALPPYAASPATLLALYAYARGDGTLARICADRALGEDPGYAMAHLVHESLDRGLPPAAIRELASCVDVVGADG